MADRSLKGMRARRKARPRLVTPVFMLVMLANFAYFLSVGVLLPTLPRYVEGPLGMGNTAVGFVIGAFALSAVILRPLTGRLGDRRGRRLLVTAGGLSFGVIVLGQVWANSFTPLLLLRLLSGAGEALFYVGVASMINDLAPDDRRGEALSYFSLALFGGLALGPVIGETVLDAWGFDPVWVVAAGFSILAGTIGFFIPETRPEGTERSVNRRIYHPAALVPGLVLAAAIWGLATFNAFVPLYTLDLGMSGSRGVFAFSSVLVFAIRLVGARIPDKLGPSRSGRTALTFAAVGLLIIGLWGTPVGLFVGTGIWSIGHSLTFPAMMAMAIKNAPLSERGAAVGTFTAFFDLAFGVGAVSAGGIASAFGYQGAFVVSSGVAAAGLVGLFVRASRRRKAGIPVGEGAEATA